MSQSLSVFGSAEEFKAYFNSFGPVTEHQIMQDHTTGRSRGFGFVSFDNEQTVEDILSHGKMHELGGKQVSKVITYSHRVSATNIETTFGSDPRKLSPAAAFGA